MAGTQEDWLRTMSDTELDALVKELEARAEQFDQKTRTLVNDELRRRGQPLIGYGRSRY